MKIVCDTNIWYGIGNGSISLNDYAFESIYATYVNVDELARTPNILFDLESVRNAIRSAMRVAKYRTIMDNPWIYLLKMDNPEFKVELEHDKAILELTTEFANDKIINKEHIKEFEENWIRPRQKELADIADVYNQLFDNIKEDIGNRKKEFRELEVIPFIKDFIRNRIGDWTEHHLGDRATLSNGFDWNQIELYVHTWALWYVELSVSNTRFQPNDAYDLSNLVYIQPNDKYWTKEKRWQRIIQDIAKLGNYLIEYKEINNFKKEST